MLGVHENVDRSTKVPTLEPVDIILFTLDAEIYLENCLDSAYREIPINKVIVIDGGSKDKTIEILNKYPRMEIHVRPDIRTTGKGVEFTFTRVTTPWFVFLDADIELPAGWYDEMVKHKSAYDFFGCKRINHYEFFRTDQSSLDVNNRPLGAPWLAKLDCFKNYHVDDDYMWRATDILLRQVAEKNGYKFGKIPDTYHYHHTTDNAQYESDSEKRGSRLVFEEPKIEILDQKNWEKRLDDFRKAVVKYIDPEYLYPRGNEGTLSTLRKLDMKWVKDTNIKWYDVLTEADIKRKRTLFEKLRSMVESTACFITCLKKDFRDYADQIRMSFK